MIPAREHTCAACGEVIGLRRRKSHAAQDRSRWPIMVRIALGVINRRSTARGLFWVLLALGAFSLLEGIVFAIVDGFLEYALPGAFVFVVSSLAAILYYCCIDWVDNHDWWPDD